MITHQPQTLGKPMLQSKIPAAVQQASKGRADPIDVAIGKEVRARRKLHGMSQTALGEKLGVSFQQVQKYERGANRISGSMAFRIAAAMGCRPGDLFPEADGVTSTDLAHDPVRGAASQLLTRQGGSKLLEQVGRLSDREFQGVCRMVAALVGED
jgi:transcriptional regulator with XRE-family HTH domain